MCHPNWPREALKRCSSPNSTKRDVLAAGGVPAHFFGAAVLCKHYMKHTGKETKWIANAHKAQAIDPPFWLQHHFGLMPWNKQNSNARMGACEFVSYWIDVALSQATLWQSGCWVWSYVVWKTGNEKEISERGFPQGKGMLKVVGGRFLKSCLSHCQVQENRYIPLS